MNKCKYKEVKHNTIFYHNGIELVKFGNCGMRLDPTGKVSESYLLKEDTIVEIKTELKK